jgi:hypothetical protein
MTRFTRFAVFMAAIFAMFALAAPASAQATRTWISGVGDDVNPCSRTAPCKTFAGAISKTATGGEIDCLDPGGFGAVTVTKAITLDCGGGIGGQAGSILASGTNGVTINCAAANCFVKIRNLTINGIQQSGSPGLSGIKFLNGGALIVEHVGIFGMGGTTDNNAGVDFEPGNTQAGDTAKLLMLDVEIQNGLGDGVLVKPLNGGSGTAALVRVSCMNNAGTGLNVDTTNLTSGTGANVSATQSNLSGNVAGASAHANASTAAATVMLTDSIVANNTSIGLVTNSVNLATMRVGSSTISGNGAALIQGGTSVLSTYGDNFVNGNTSSETFPSAPIGKK